MIFVCRPITKCEIMAENTKLEAAVRGGDQAEGDVQVQMKQKYTYVKSWLEKVFAGDEPPEFEINSQTVDILYAMAQENERREREMEIVLEDLQQKTEEYAAETARLQSEMKWIGFSTKELSSTSLGYVQSLAGIANALELRDCSDTSYCLALSDLCQQRAGDSLKRDEMERELERQQEEVRKALIKQANHKRVLSQLGEEMTAVAPTLGRQQKEEGFLKQKAVEYQKLVSTMKDELKSIGYDPSISHTALQQCSKEIEELQSQLAPLKMRLASYQDLPPDLSLARVKIEEAKRELGKLEAELTNSIDLVHAEK